MERIEQFARQISVEGMKEESLAEYPKMGEVLVSLNSKEEIQYIKDMKDLFNKSNIMFQLFYDLCNNKTEMEVFMYLWNIALEGGTYEDK